MNRKFKVRTNAGVKEYLADRAKLINGWFYIMHGQDTIAVIRETDVQYIETCDKDTDTEQVEIDITQPESKRRPFKVEDFLDVLNNMMSKGGEE